MDTNAKDAEKNARPRVIESASGTTDPENASSGPAAYVVFLVVVALLVALATGVSGCVSSLAEVAVGSAGRLSERAPSRDERVEEIDLDLDDVHDLFSNEPLTRAQLPGRTR